MLGNNIVEANREYDITVDYTQSLNEMIAATQASSVNLNPEDFTFQQEGKIDMRVSLIEFDLSRYEIECMSPNGIIALLEDIGYRPGNLAELCSLGAAHRNDRWVLNAEIVALGSPTTDEDDKIRYPEFCQSEDLEFPQLGLSYSDEMDFESGYYFAVKN